MTDYTKKWSMQHQHNNKSKLSYNDNSTSLLEINRHDIQIPIS
jgi:hypothetical protein